MLGLSNPVALKVQCVSFSDQMEGTWEKCNVLINVLSQENNHSV